MKKVFLILPTIFLILLTGCFTSKVNDAQVKVAESIKENATENEKPSEVVKESISETKEKTAKTYDYFATYDTEIKKEVENEIASAKSLQDEIDKVKKIADKYIEAFSGANTQGEMNFSSAWAYTVWDTELNNLWKRISDSADKERKQLLLDEQRNWIAMKEEVVRINLGNKEDGGSIYPMLQNQFLAEITHNRCCVLARELAIIKHEDFVIPTRSKYGTYVDNQGTKSVYSSIVTRKNVENDDEAIISIYRVGTTEGTFTESSNGDLIYTSYDENVKGIIQIYGWEKAIFDVTESKNNPLAVGDKFTFDFAY